jgi:sporulation protein YlmC with PRC-barrel domain
VSVRYALLAVICCIAPATSAEVVQIGVFSLFRPVELRVAPVSDPLLIAAGDARVILEGRQFQIIRLARLSSPVHVSARDGSNTEFRLSIPGKIDRQFHGTLTVRAGDHKLIAVVSMDREVAVASVVAAEMPPSTPIEALKAQAVVARSYYAAAGPRHDDFEFCDTTHCQFLRELPAPTAGSFRATLETRGLVLAYRARPIAALWQLSMADQVLYLTELLGLTEVYDLKGRKLGVIKDAAIVRASGSSFPHRSLPAIVGGGHAWLTVRHDQIRSIGFDGIYLKDEHLTPYHSDEYMLRMVRDLLDQQIIDAEGRKVVRVTDVTFDPRHENGGRCSECF